MTALEKFSHAQLVQACPQIYDLTTRLHGSAGQSWRRYLGGLGEAGISSALDQHRAAWLGLPEIAELLQSDPQTDSVLHRFALLSAGLRMAIEAQVLPWTIASAKHSILSCALRWANDKNESVVTLEQKIAVQKLHRAILAARDANRLIVLNMGPGSRGGPAFGPVPEHAALYQDIDLKYPGTIFGFIKNAGADTRILLFHEAFHSLSAECGDRDALVDYLKRKNLLKIKTEKVKRSSDQYYVLAGTFLDEMASV